MNDTNYTKKVVSTNQSKGKKKITTFKKKSLFKRNRYS